MSEPVPHPASPTPLDAPDAALAAAVVDDEEAPFDLDDLAAEVGAGRALLEAVARTGLLLPHHLDADGTARYSRADAQAVRAGLTLLDAGLPLGELLELARRADEAVGSIATAAVDAFLRFVRDPVRGTAVDDDEAATRLLTAYHEMLPATERLVAHHLRRRLLAEAGARIAEQADTDAAPASGADVADVADTADVADAGDNAADVADPDGTSGT